MSIPVLKNIVQFVDLAPGASASAPHLLTAQGMKVVPDHLFASVENIGMTADDTDVTVTNNGFTTVTVDVLCERWFSPDRAFPPGVEDLTPQPFIAEQDSANAAKPNTVVYRCDATGSDDPGGNVYTNWQDAYEAARFLVQYGGVQIQFDSRFSQHNNAEGFPACPIPDSSGEPGGFWDMDQISWGQAPEGKLGFVPFVQSEAARIDFLAGAEVRNLGLIKGDIMYITRDVPGGPQAGGILVPDSSALVLEGPIVGLGNTTPGSGPLVSAEPGAQFFTVYSLNMDVGYPFGAIESGTGFGGGSLAEPVLDSNGTFFGGALRGTSGVVENNSIAGRWAINRYNPGFPGPLGRQEFNAINYPSAVFANYGNQFIGGGRSAAEIPDFVKSERGLQYGFTASYDTSNPPDAKYFGLIFELPSAIVRDGESLRFKDRGGNAATNPIYIVAKPGETIDGAAQTPATATLTCTANLSDGDQVEIGGKVYTAKSSPAAPDDFQLGPDLATTLSNLATRINDDSINNPFGDQNPPGNALVYQVIATANPTTLDIVSRFEGEGGNNITTSDPVDSGTVMSWGGATMSGGAGGYKIDSDLGAVELSTSRDGDRWHAFGMNP